MELFSVLALGFLLGMRHATDSDHVVAVSAIVSRERSVWAASWVGAVWGVGHSVTIALVGGAIVAFGLVLPPRVAMGMELLVALMLVLLGAANVVAFRRDAESLRRAEPAAETHARLRRDQALRSLIVGTVHGFAGSAAVVLLVLATIHDARLAVLYLLLFGAGTVAGMILITTALSVPLVLSARRFAFQRHLGWVTGLMSVAFGLGLAYQVGFVDGLFGPAAPWTR